MDDEEHGYREAPMSPGRVLLAHLLPGLSGRGVVLAHPADRAEVRRRLVQEHFGLAEVDLTPAGEPRRGQEGRDTLHRVQAAVADALGLPSAAARNLDALVDSLRDLALWWPDHERVALLLGSAETLVDADLPGWHILTDILRSASDDLWRGGDLPGDRVFETVAFVDGHGVRAVTSGPAR